MGQQVPISVEVTHISANGLWVIVGRKEYFLPYDAFPWFRQATVAQILDVQLIGKMHLRWPELDVDLDLHSLENLEAYPLIYK